METVEIKREKSKKLTVRYLYPGGGAGGIDLQPVGVRFGDLVKFDFTKVAQFESLPSSLFEEPSGLR
jgi:hypothetical protein